MPSRDEITAAVDAVTKELIDEGKVIEAGWAAMKLFISKRPPPTKPEDWGELLRECYFGGAQHVWSSVMSMLDPGAEPTDKDLERMDKINDEMTAWHAQMSAKDKVRP